MSNGLNINKKEFLKLKRDDQLAILYENTEDLKIMVKGYKFNQRIQYTWLGVLTIAFGFGKFVLGII